VLGGLRYQSIGCIDKGDVTHLIVHGPGGGDEPLVLGEVRISWYIGLREGEIAYVEYYTG